MVDIHKRHKKLPAGFKRHQSAKCPVAPDQYVEVMIKTAEGIGSGGICRARDHQWNRKAHPDGIGAVVGYRLADGPR